MVVSAFSQLSCSTAINVKTKTSGWTQVYLGLVNLSAEVISSPCWLVVDLQRNGQSLFTTFFYNWTNIDYCRSISYPNGYNTHNTRESATNHVQPRFGTNKGLNSFRSYATKMWNALPTVIKTCKSLDTLDSKGTFGWLQSGPLYGCMADV